jgi:hypothetical protein
MRDLPTTTFLRVRAAVRMRSPLQITATVWPLREGGRFHEDDDIEDTEGCE